jgi:predicted DNA-binding protein (UPF0251 family)
MARGISQVKIAKKLGVHRITLASFIKANEIGAISLLSGEQTIKYTE